MRFESIKAKWQATTRIRVETSQKFRIEGRIEGKSREGHTWEAWPITRGGQQLPVEIQIGGMAVSTALRGESSITALHCALMH